MNSCGAALGVDEGGGGNERVGDIFRNVLNATWVLAVILGKDHFVLDVGVRSNQGDEGTDALDGGRTRR